MMWLRELSSLCSEPRHPHPPCCARQPLPQSGRGEGGPRCLVLLFVLAVGGCSGGLPGLDTIPPDSGWQPQGVNAANIRAMAAHPADLAEGRGDPGALGAESEPAVERLWNGHPKPLLGTDIEGDASAGAPSPPPAPGPGGSN